MFDKNDVDGALARWAEFNNPDRYKTHAVFNGILAEKVGGMSALAAMIAWPLLDAARSLARIADALEERAKED